MDESDDVIKATNDLLKQDPPSSQPSNIKNNNESIEYEQKKKQNLLTQITYGEETIPITDRFAINCKIKVAVYADKNAPSIMVNVPEITRMYEIFKRNSKDKTGYRCKFG